MSWSSWTDEDQYEMEACIRDDERECREWEMEMFIEECERSFRQEPQYEIPFRERMADKRRVDEKFKQRDRGVRPWHDTRAVKWCEENGLVHKLKKGQIKWKNTPWHKRALQNKRSKRRKNLKQSAKWK